MFHAFYTVVRVMWRGMKGFSVHTGWDVGRRNVACYWTLQETQWLRKRHITIRPMNQGLNKFQTDYILARETFFRWKLTLLWCCVKLTLSCNCWVICHTVIIWQGLKLIWQLTSILHRHLHTAGVKGNFQPKTLRCSYKQPMVLYFAI